MRPTFFALLLLCTASNAFAIPALRLSWDDCSVIALDKSFAGPGPYTLVVSGVGFSGNYSGLGFAFAFNPHRVAPAWDVSQFDYDGGTPCQDPSRLSVTAGGGTCPVYPATRDGYMFEGSITPPGQTVLTVNVHFDPAFDASEPQRYELAKIVFDHANSVAGPGGAGTCGGADAPMCINLVFASLGRPGGVPAGIVYESTYLTWQDPTNALRCPGGATPAQAKTWGGIKATYR